MSPGDFVDSHACPPRRSGTGQKVKESRRKVLACWALHHQCFVYSTMRILVEDKIQETLFFKHYWINFISFSELNGSLYKYLPNSDVNFGLENSLWRASERVNLKPLDMNCASHLMYAHSICKALAPRIKTHH